MIQYGNKFLMFVDVLFMLFFIILKHTYILKVLMFCNAYLLSINHMSVSNKKSASL